MNNHSKKFYIIIFNILILIILFFVFDFIIFKKAEADFHNKFPDDTREIKYSYETKLPYDLYGVDNYFVGDNVNNIELPESVYLGRLPDGLEYNDKMPIVLFGCSYAYGQFLEPTQTFSYKLAHLLKRPVHNRAVGGWGIQHMLYQTERDSFYKDIKDTDTVIYIMIRDHYKRMQLEHYFIVVNWVYLNYKLKFGKLMKDNYKNPLSNFYRALYTRKLINHINADRIDKPNNEKEVNKLNKLVAKYFTETKKNIEKRLGKNINFIVVFYELDNCDIPNRESLTELLNKNGIEAFSIRDITNKNMTEDPYIMPDGHPTEAAWDLLTPLIAERIGLTH